MSAPVRSATDAWRNLLRDLTTRGQQVSPRGLDTHELLHHTFAFDLSMPVVRSPARRLSYKFMAAEALWILAGDDRVATIAPYNTNIAQFSDDGETFFGAYGPRVAAQLEHVINALAADRDTRQAVLTTWRPSPPKTKDTPCTVALAFTVRHNALNVHAFMRSSDAWLGVPYDVFNFSMVGVCVACALNKLANDDVPPVVLGTLHLTAVSSHLYNTNYDAALAVLAEPVVPPDEARARALTERVVHGDWLAIDEDVRRCRDRDQEPRYWRVQP